MITPPVDRVDTRGGTGAAPSLVVAAVARHVTAEISDVAAIVAAAAKSRCLA
jgi:phage-related protein